MTTIAEKTESGAKAEHTPTPWKLNGGGATIYADPDNGVGQYLGQLGLIIPHIAYIPRNSCAASTEEQKANADFILRACNSFDMTLAAMKQGRSALAVLAQSDPTYEPAWRALTDAIKAAEGPMRPEDQDGPYLILDVETVNRGDMLLWWNPKCAGYTTRIEEAGRYSAEQVRRDPLYFNNGERTLAIPERDVLQYAVRITPSDGTMLDKMRQHADAARERRNEPKAE